MEQFSLIPDFDAAAQGAAGWPSGDEILNQMIQDETARVAKTAKLGPFPFAALKTRKSRKPRRQPINVSEATPF